MADIFDQLASGQQPQTASAQSTPAPGQSPQPQQGGGGDVFDQLAAGASPNTTANQPASADATAQQQSPPAMYASEGSLPDDPLRAKVKLWAQNLQADMKYGTDITGVGSLLKKMGAHGLYSGESKGVGDFVGSLPLGLLRALQGGAEVTLPNEKWQGAKDVVGGALDASQIPGSFIAPEPEGIVSKGADAILTQAERAANALPSLSVTSVQPKIQGAITSAIQQAAQEHGVPLPDGVSVRDITQTLADSLRAKAHTVYQQLDSALGGTRFQTFDEQLENINRAIKDSLGIEPEKDAALAKRLQAVTDARNAAMDQVRAKGLDPDGLIDQANALHQRSMALQDVSRAVRSSTDVHPSAQTLATEGTNTPAPANVRTAPLFKRIQQLATPNPKYPGAPSRLVQALGEERAADLLHAVDSAHLAAQKIAARNAWIKRGATALGLAGLGREAYNGAHALLSGQ